MPGPKTEEEIEEQRKKDKKLMEDVIKEPIRYIARNKKRGALNKEEIAKLFFNDEQMRDRLALNKRNIDTLFRNDDELEKRIKRKKEQIAENKEQIAENKAAIESNDEHIQLNTIDIAANNQKLDKVNQKLDQLIAQLKFLSDFNKRRNAANSLVGLSRGGKTGKTNIKL